MAIALIPISTLQQYFEAAHSLPSEKQKPFYLSVLHDFGRFDLAKAMQHLYEIRSDRWIRIRPEDFEDLMEHYICMIQEHLASPLQEPDKLPVSREQTCP